MTMPTSERPRIGIASHGLWRGRDGVAILTNADPVRLWPILPAACDLVAGWGFKPSAARARRIAERRGLPYVAFEDGFLKSVTIGAEARRIGWIVDRGGIYYDARGASDLEAAGRRRASAGDAAAAAIRARAEAGLAELRRLRLSKYNHAPMLAPSALGLPAGRDVVLVVDQTAGDASIPGALADATRFEAMLSTAVAENPGRAIAVKVHPETISGAKRGPLLEAARRHGAVVIDADVNPWSLIETAIRVYAVSSQFGFEAMLAGVPVTCFGAAFYAGWGLTDDRFEPLARRAPIASRADFAAAAYLDYCRWLDPYTGAEIDFEAAIDRLAFLRDRHHDNRRSVCVGISRWKRRTFTDFLSGVDGPPRFAPNLDAARADLARAPGRMVVWGSRPVAPTSADEPEPVRAEDGFLRSVGLGAAFVTPASLVFDRRGIYYDPSRPSDLEVLARETTFDPALIARAARLRQTIVTHGLSKYNESETTMVAPATGRPRILVPGQVEDDASVRLGSPVVRSNLELLRRVRARWPDAEIVFKPHPDVVAGYRAGAVPLAEAMRHADRVIDDVSISALLACVDRVETMTSLTGFEALLRGLSVTTHGLPFYAGWGLTEDLLACPRRDRRLTLDELVAVALILYPCYVDPVTGQPCAVETVVERMIAARAAGGAVGPRLRRRLRHAGARLAHLLGGRFMRRGGG